MELFEVTKALLERMAAEGGWRRVGEPFMHEGTAHVIWTGEGDVRCVTPFVDVLPEPLRQAVRADLIGFFKLACPVCEARAQWFTVDEATEAGGLAQVVTFHRFGAAGGEVTVEVAREVFAIVHDDECPASPRSIDGMLAAGLN